MLIGMSKGSKRWAGRWPGMFVALVTLLLGGCAHSGRGDHADEVWREPVAEIPAFLKGPAAILLTNSDGFQGRVTMEKTTSSSRGENISGDLMGLGPKLMFVPHTHDSGGKHGRGGGLSYIWDVSENRGYILSEPLQGYAPLNSPVRLTNIVVQERMTKEPLERIQGHPCEQFQALVSSSDGKETTLKFSRATDLKGFPLRIDSTNSSPGFTLNFLSLRLQTPPLEAFRPPEAFTRFETADAMMSEILRRQQSIRHGKAVGAEFRMHGEGHEGRAY
jgi:hypothetical protein